jgi:hypothetical protein
MVWPRITADCAKHWLRDMCSRSKRLLLLSYREIVFEIYPSTVPEPRWLQEARYTFNAELAAAADTRRQALLMGLHQRCAAMHATEPPATEQSWWKAVEYLSGVAAPSKDLLPSPAASLTVSQNECQSQQHVLMSSDLVNGVNTVRPRVQVGCGGVFAVPPARRTVARHHG